MSIADSFNVALLCLSMVFVLLFCLYIVVRLSTRIIRFVEAKMKK